MSQELRVGLDYGVATRHAPGVGRYARELCRALARSATTEISLHLLDIGEGASSLVEPALGLEGSRVVARRLKGELSRRAARLLARPLGVESWFGGLDHVHQVLRPLWPVRRATTSLAISELPLPGSQEESELARALAEVDQVHVFSSHYREEVLHRFDRAAESVVQIPVGCDHWRRDLPADLPPRPRDLVLVLGAQRTEREPLTVFRGFEQLVNRGREARLVYAGRRGDASAELERAIAESPHGWRVQLAPQLGERELPGLVGSASVLVHLSREEGTPVTVLEALAVGAAVVASPLPAFREALGDEASWLEGEGAAERAQQLGALLERALEESDPGATARRLELASGFSWEACAAATEAAWRRLATREP